MRLVVGFALMAALAAAGESAGGDKVKTKLEGKWQVVSSVNNGNEDADAKEHSVVITGKSFVVKKGDEAIFKGDLKADDKKKPAQVDFHFTMGPPELEDKTAKGIYELKGDTLRICLSNPGEDRPAEFTSAEGSMRHLVTLKRAPK
jgi:uncharacterized protein (TIGR03067 family)